MIPFYIDPRWYEEHWYGDPGNDGESEAPPRLRTGRFGRIAVCLVLVAAVPALSYLGFQAAARNPGPHTAPAWQD